MRDQQFLQNKSHRRALKDISEVLEQNYLSPTISELAEKTLLKTAYYFLLLLVGFGTLTYRKDYDRSPILVGHQ